MCVTEHEVASDGPCATVVQLALAQGSPPLGTGSSELSAAPLARRARAGRLLANPQRHAKALGVKLAGIDGARLGRDWLVPSEVVDAVPAVQPRTAPREVIMVR